MSGASKSSGARIKTVPPRYRQSIKLQRAATISRISASLKRGEALPTVGDLERDFASSQREKFAFFDLLRDLHDHRVARWLWAVHFSSSIVPPARVTFDFAFRTYSASLLR